MDFVIWVQHVMVHAVPALWRLHRVHHADLDYDLTTGARFHPIEIILSMLIKLATIMVLGPPVVAVILFEVILNGMAMFNHGNVRLPCRWTGRCAGWWSPRTCTGCTTRWRTTRPTPTSASTCPGGTGCSAPTATSPAAATRA